MAGQAVSMPVNTEAGKPKSQYVGWSSYCNDVLTKLVNLALDQQDITALASLKSA